MKKIKLISLSLIFILAACGGNNPSTNSEGPKFEITESDKIAPGEDAISLDYNPMIDCLDHYEYDSERYYVNKLELGLPDPFVLYDDGVYYIYGTTDRVGAKSLDCYETTDFSHFKVHMNIDVLPSGAWDNNGAHSRFAPEVYKFDETFYLYYSDCDNTGKRYISVMTSDSPTGPFIEYKNGEMPCFDGGEAFSVLDQTIFQDDNGDLYMYYSIYETSVMQYIIGVKLKSPTEADWSTYKVLVRPGEINASTLRSNLLTWEAQQAFKVAEGPFMIKSPVNGKYYLTYSVNHYPDRSYSVCYAVSDSPLGDYTKPFSKDGTWTNLLFGYAGPNQGTPTSVYGRWEGFASGCAHHCFFKCGEQYMIGYHAHKNRSNGARGFGFDKLYFDEEGVPFCVGPTYSVQPLPEDISGMRNLAKEAQWVTEGIENPERLFDDFVVEHYTLAQEKDRETVVSDGNGYIKLKFSKKYNITGIFLYNSCYFETAASEDLPFIKFSDNQYIDSVSFSYMDNINYEKEFIKPASAYTIDLYDGVYTDYVLIKIADSKKVNLNELVILGCEVE